MSYLESIGVGLDRVKYIIATHWHDDHIRGLGEMYVKCSNASFSFSNAIKSREFGAIVAALGRKCGTQTSGVDTLFQIFDESARRVTRGNFFHASPVMANSSITPHASRFEIVALSPSSPMCLQAIASLSNLMPKAGDQKRRVIAPSCNETAVVLWIQVGNRKMLLGADLEETASSQGEWTRLMVHATGRSGAEVFKVPHHGSQNGDHPNIWNTLLTSNPVAVLTPYSKLTNPLPTAADIVRLKTNTSNAAITRRPTGTPSISRTGARNKMILQSTRKYRPVPMSTGRIRLRAPIFGNDPWQVAFFGTAGPL